MMSCCLGTMTAHINHHSHPAFELMQLFLTTLRTEAQHKFSVSTLKDARPFLSSIDVIAMNIPHYPEIVTHPMDFSTIERELNFSSPTKPNPNHENPTDQFIVDVRLVFANCVKFNSLEHAIWLMGRRVERSCSTSRLRTFRPLKRLNPLLSILPPAPAPPVPTPTTSASAKQCAPCRPSTLLTSIIWWNDSISAGGSRPKREIHPPPSKDLPYADIPKKSRKARAAKDRFCWYVHSQVSG